MVAAVRLSPERLPAFLGENGVAVLHVQVAGRAPFASAIAQQLDGLGPEVRLGAIDLLALLRNPRVASRLAHGLAATGAAGRLGVLPGYYLFVSGELVHWTPGLPGQDDVKELVRGAVFGAFFSGVAGSPSFVGLGLEQASGRCAGRRVAGSFRRALAEHRAARGHRAPPRRPRTYEDALRRAYALLEVEPSASDRHVQEAWRKKRVEHHPDRAGDDAAERARRTLVSTEINLAWDLICAHRAGRGRAARC